MREAVGLRGTEGTGSILTLLFSLCLSFPYLSNGSNNNCTWLTEPEGGLSGKTLANSIVDGLLSMGHGMPPRSFVKIIPSLRFHVCVVYNCVYACVGAHMGKHACGSMVASQIILHGSSTLFTEAVSLHQTQSWAKWLIQPVSLLWGSPVSDFQDWNCRHLSRPPGRRGFLGIQTLVLKD